MGAAGTEDNNLSKTSQLSEDDDVGVDHEGDSYSEMGSDNNSLMKGEGIEESDILSYKSPNDRKWKFTHKILYIIFCDQCMYPRYNYIIASSRVWIDE